MTLRTLTLWLALAFAAALPVYAQQAQDSPGVGPKGEHLVGAGAQKVDIITPHISDSHELELPGFVWHLPRWEPIHIGGLTIDMSPTKHVIWLGVAALLCLIVMSAAAMSHARFTGERGHPRGFGTAMEAVILYFRNEVILPNVGPHGAKYVPFCLTLFFFILFANMMGLLPYGSTATGNIAVTGTLATITFIMIEVAGIRAQGWGYLKTIVYLPPKDMPVFMKPVMVLIMTPIEIIGKFTKPFALAIRLFANMTAGHVVLLAIISLIFTFHSWSIALFPVLMGVGLSLLELFVAALQAFIFSLLAAVFIGLIRQGGH